MARDADLMQVVGTLNPVGCRTHALHCREQQAD
jgi:hypothetical protein